MFSVLRTLGLRFRDVMAEFNYAQRRAIMLQVNPDSYEYDPANVPDTYEAFLFRTTGPLTREPSAAQRSHGRLVR
jgi:hypothetical protein